MSCDLKNEVCEFKCTGYEGSKVWEKLHKIPNEIECEECKSHAKRGLMGYHDLVNAGLGKTLFDKKNFNRFANEVECVRKKCKLNGTC